MLEAKAGSLVFFHLNHPQLTIYVVISSDYWMTPGGRVFHFSREKLNDLARECVKNKRFKLIVE